MQNMAVPKTDTNNSIEVISILEMKTEDKLSELQEKQKQLEELKSI